MEGRNAAMAATGHQLDDSVSFGTGQVIEDLNS